jgi:hypothetical protein
MARRARRGWPGDVPGFDIELTGRTSFGYFRVSKNPDRQEQKSVSEQKGEYLEWNARAGTVTGDQYADDDRSASRFSLDARGRSTRENFTRLRDDIAAGRHDGQVLWFWSSSRQTRGDIPLDVLAAESAGHGIVWVTGSRVLNPACEDDMFVAGVNHLMDRQLSVKISRDVTRGKEGAAMAGRPSSAPAYGYRRVHARDERGALVLVKGRPVIAGVEFDAAGSDGQPEPGSPAAVAAGIFTRLEAGESLSAIAHDLSDRRVRVPKFPVKCTVCGRKLAARECPAGHEQDLFRWNVTTVRSIAANPAYIGRRVYQAESNTPRGRLDAVLAGVRVMWQPLVSDEQFWAVHRIITDPARLRYPGGRSDAHLMSTVARCGVCGSPLGCGATRRRDRRYSCTLRGCVSVSAADLEAWAEDRLVSWLVLPEVRTRIWGRPDDDEAVKQARADLERLEAEMKDLKRRVRLGPKRGGVSLDMAAAAEAGIVEQTAEAEAVIQAAEAPPPEFYDLIGPDAADRWVALKTANLRDARAVLAEVATVYVGPASRMGRNSPVDGRAQWHWNIGPDASSPRVPPFAEFREKNRQALAQARETIGEMLRADPSLANSVIARKAGCDPGTVQQVRARLAGAGEITEPGYRVSAGGRRYALAAHPRWGGSPGR